MWWGVWTDGKQLGSGDILIGIPARGSWGSAKAIAREMGEQKCIGEGSFTGQKLMTGYKSSRGIRRCQKWLGVSFSPQNTFLKLKLQE